MKRKRKRKSPTMGLMTETRPTVMSRKRLRKGVELRNLTRAKMPMTAAAMNQQIAILKTRPLFSLKFPANIVRNLMFTKQQFFDAQMLLAQYLLDLSYMRIQHSFENNNNKKKNRGKGTFIDAMIVEQSSTKAEKHT